jgi:hypothetical protein
MAALVLTVPHPAGADDARRQAFGPDRFCSISAGAIGRRCLSNAAIAAGSCGCAWLAVDFFYTLSAVMETGIANLTLWDC